jgi:hypothetical protein
VGGMMVGFILAVLVYAMVSTHTKREWKEIINNIEE